MTDEQQKIIKDLDDVISKYQGSIIKDVENNEGKLYYKDVMKITILQRSLSLIDAYKRLLASNNIMTLNALSRLQIDNCIFIYGVYYLLVNNYNINDIYLDIIKNNKKLSEYKVDKNKLTDTFLVTKIDEKYNNKFLELYNFCCRFVHYSDTASLLSMQPNGDGNIIFNLSIDYDRFSESVIINGKSFVNISKKVLLMINDLWKDVEKGVCIN